jgi:hypothetical protein
MSGLSRIEALPVSALPLTTTSTDINDEKATCSQREDVGFLAGGRERVAVEKLSRQIFSVEAPSGRGRAAAIGQSEAGFPLRRLKNKVSRHFFLAPKFRRKLFFLGEPKFQLEANSSSFPCLTTYSLRAQKFECRAIWRFKSLTQCFEAHWHQFAKTPSLQFGFFAKKIVDNAFISGH